MADEAFEAVNDKIDFKPYDNDGNGYVRLLTPKYPSLLNGARSMLLLLFMQAELPRRQDLEATSGASNGFCHRNAKQMVMDPVSAYQCITDKTCRGESLRLPHSTCRRQMWRMCA